MDTLVLKDILAELVQIRLLLVTLVVIWGVFVVIGIWIIVTVRRARNNLFNDAATSKFRSDAEVLLNRGAYTMLKDQAKTRVDSYPHDVWALYYLGIAELRLEAYVQARSYLSKALELNPGWEDAIKPYIDEAEKVVKPRDSTVVE
jgi:tetratricopeptide (TPR) repeat protein